MAGPKRSAGSLAAALCGRHHSKAPLTARLDTSLIQNGATMPNPAMAAPPSAGPSARDRFTPTLLAVIAAGRSSLGTSCGTTACQAGPLSAQTELIRNVNNRRLTGLA